MQNLTLVIGSKTRSSWSLRPWLFLRHHGVRFEEIEIPLGRSDTKRLVLEQSPSGKVPCLRHGDVRVWESLAICEYAAERFALPAAWPMDPNARAFARAIAAEMHAGFADLRAELPFDTQRRPGSTITGEAANADISRVRAIWRQARNQYGEDGPWLFGAFGIVDAMYAPVALRFHQYDIPLQGIEREYMFQVLMHPAVQDWLEQADQSIAAQAIAATQSAEPLAARTQQLPAGMTATPGRGAAARAVSQAAAEALGSPSSSFLGPLCLPEEPAVLAPEPSAPAPRRKSVILPP